MRVTNICTINGDTYSIRRDVDKNKYTLWRNKEVIVAIIRIEYDNWKGHQVKFRPYSSPAELDYLDADGLTALEDSIAYLNEYFGT